MLLLDTMYGKKVPRAPSVPKIWIDLAANLLGRETDGWGRLMGGVDTLSFINKSPQMVRLEAE